MSAAVANTNRGTTANHYRPGGYVAHQTVAQRAGPNITDDYERWYTEATPNNRMLLSLRSGIDSEIAWALDRLCRLCDNEQFVLKAIPGLTDALFEWPEWYAREGAIQIEKTAALFSPPPDQERKRRHALECLFVLRNAALNEPNALELSTHPRTQPLIFQSFHNIEVNSDANSEFILHAIELLQAIAFRVYLPAHAPRLHVEALSKVECIAGQSSDRSMIIASLTALTLIYSHTTNVSHMTIQSPAFLASIRYLPLFIDKVLVDTCLNYIFTHLSHPPMAKAFLLHPEMPGVLKLLVSLLLSEQVEETVSLEIGGTVETVPALIVTTRDHELTQTELDELLPKPEPQRCYEWMKTMFVPKTEGELTQVDFWNLYKDVFTPYHEKYPALGASDVIKSVNVVFPHAQAMVLPGPVQRFVVRGVDRRKEDVSGDLFKCHWQRSQCNATPFNSPGDLYDHILEHISDDGSDTADVASPGSSCLWSTCSASLASRANLRAHVLTHLRGSQPLPKHPDQDDTITLPPGQYPYPMSTPTTRPPPPLRKTTVTYRRPVVDPPSSSLTALLCIRILFRTSFISTDDAPRVDADHFGFPGLVDDAEGMDEDAGSEDAEREGARRGRKAFVGVRRLMEGVQIRDEALMSWIVEMIDAGISGSAI